MDPRGLCKQNGCFSCCAYAASCAAAISAKATTADANVRARMIPFRVVLAPANEMRRGLFRVRRRDPLWSRTGSSRGDRALLGVTSERGLLRRLAAQHAIPPGADAGHELVVALDHVGRLAQARRRGRDADRAGFGALFGGHPQTVVPPHARPPGDLLRLPIVDVDHAPAPAILDNESGRRVRVERGDLVVDVPA